jgi:hypothetical protein
MGIRAALLVSLLLAQAQSTAAPPVGLEMRNVSLHVAADAVIEVKWLSGRLQSVSAHPPVFDDQRSFTIDVDDGEVAVDAASLTALVSRAFDYKGAALSDLRLSFDQGHVVQRGTLKKGISVPFSIVAEVSATSEGLLKVHPLKVKAAGIPSAKLMSLFGVELDDILKSRPDRGIDIRDNDLLLDAAHIVPAPQMKGRLSHAFVRGDRLVQVFGKGAAAAARQSGNYVWFRGASIRFGRLTMADADLKLIDADPKDPFDFYPERYNDQLVAGYSKNTPDHALRTYMPDFSDLPRRRR